MSDHTPDETIGQRVARARKRRALTQHGLAERTHYARSTIAQIEQGHRIAAPAFIAAAAAALGVDPADLYGQPFRGDTPQRDAVHAAIPDLRRALTFVEVPPDLDRPLRPLEDIDRDVAECQRLRRAARHTQLGAHLPSLMEELIAHAHHDSTPHVWRQLWHVYEGAGELTRRLGYNDLAAHVLERSAATAGLAGDPHVPAMVARRRALLMANMAAFKPALTLLRNSIRDVDPDSAGAQEASGALHLRAAITAARAGDASAAWDHYEQAADIRHRAGRDMDAYGTNFVVGNVGVHGAAVAVELGDLEEAVRRDALITTSVLARLSPERQAHHGVDMARVHLDLGNLPAALDRITKAERTAPQMTRFHPAAKAMVQRLVDLRREIPEPLRGLMRRMSLT